MTDRTGFGELLREYRQRKGLKQSDLAYRIGKHNRASIQAWENSHYHPASKEIVLAVAKALDLTESETDNLLIACGFQPEQQPVGARMEEGGVGNFPDLPQSLETELAARRLGITVDIPPDFRDDLEQVIKAERYYQVSGDLSALERALTVWDQILARASFSQAGEPFQLEVLNGAAQAFLRCYSATGHWDYLDKAISLWNEATQRVAIGSPFRPLILNNLGRALYSRYERLGHMEDLEQAISAYREAVQITPPDTSDLPNYLTNLGLSLRVYYERTRRLEDLEQAIRAYQEAIELTPTNSSFLATYLMNLGSSLRDRYTRTGQLEDLERAIEIFQRVVQLTPLASSFLHRHLNDLAESIYERYVRTGRLEDLEEAIGLLQRVAQRIPSSSPDLAGVLNTVGTYLKERYARTGQLEDLEQAIRAYQEALQHTSPNSPDRSNYLAHLDSSLYDHYVHTGQWRSLERAQDQTSLSLLLSEAWRFFQEAGFKLTMLGEPGSFLCLPVTSMWQKKMNQVNYVRILTGQSLDGDDVLHIREAAQQLDAAITLAFVVIDKPVADNAWLHIAALRAKNFNVIPVPSTLFFESRTIGKATAAGIILEKHLERFLVRGIDPYNIRHPVFDVLNFFGREPLARDILEQMRAGQPIGLFGLRKIGKSSLMRYIQGLMPCPTACIDLQAGTELVGLFERILRAWNNDAQARFDLDLGLQDIALSTGETAAEFVKVTQATLDRLALLNSEARLAIFFDEIELIVPPRRAVGPVLEGYLSLMRILRGLVQEDGRILLMVAGLDPAINRMSRWGDEQEQNPFFMSLQEAYLPPLLEPDCVQMIRNIGTQVGLSYSDEAATYVAQMSGGHPSLTRQLCSLTYGQRHQQPGEVTLPAIQQATERFLFDPKYASSINDMGLWSEATHAKLWGEQGAQINQAILLTLAQSMDPVAESIIIQGPDLATRRSALFALRELHIIRSVEEPVDTTDPHCTIAFGLLRSWIRRIKLGLEG